MLVIDTVAGRIIGNDEIKHKIATEQPYRKWLDENLIKLNAIKLTTELPKFDPKPCCDGNWLLAIRWKT